MRSSYSIPFISVSLLLPSVFSLKFLLFIDFAYAFSSWGQEKSSNAITWGSKSEKSPLEYLLFRLDAWSSSSCSGSWNLSQLVDYFSQLLPFMYKPLYTNDVPTGFQSDTRAAIPGWDGLLYIYSIFLVPVLFVLLVGLNMGVWSSSRINYVFIFGQSSHSPNIFHRTHNRFPELDLRTKIDYRQYFEVGSLH